MKVNNLLKKVGSVITTVALLATLGTTAFATDDVTVGVGGDGISITKVETVKHADSADVYDVTVTYKTTKDNTVGMTMLVYKNSDDSGLDVKTGSGADNSYKNESMQIIGIDQTNAESGSDGSAKEGSFTFSVTTNAGTTEAPNVYHIKKGKKALIAVSGDKCTPAYALFGVNAVADSATINVTKVTLDAHANATDEEIKGLLNNEVMNAKIVIMDADEKEIAQVGVSNATASGWEKQADGTFKNTYTFAQGCKTVSGVDFQKPISVSITATITKTAVSGTVAKLGSAEVTGNVATISVNNSVLKDATDLSALTTYLNTNYADVQLKADGLTDTIENGASFESSDNYGASKTSYTYTATVNADTGKNGNVKLDANQPITVTVNITSDSITDVKLMKDSDVFGETDSVEINEADSKVDDSIVNVVKAKLKAAGWKISYVKNSNPATTVEVDGSDIGYGTPVVDKENKKVTLKILTIGNVSVGETPVNIEVSYTVKPEKQILLGDVDGDGVADDLDYSAFYNHYTGISIFDALNDHSTDNYKAADIDGNGTVDDLDYSAYYNHYTGISVDPNIGKPVTK